MTAFRTCSGRSSALTRLILSTCAESGAADPFSREIDAHSDSVCCTMDGRKAPSAPEVMHRRSQLTSHQSLRFVRKRILAIALLLAAALLIAGWQSGGFRSPPGQRTINAAAGPAHPTPHLKALAKKQRTFNPHGL